MKLALLKIVKSPSLRDRERERAMSVEFSIEARREKPILFHFPEIMPAFKIGECKLTNRDCVIINYTKYSAIQVCGMFILGCLYYSAMLNTIRNPYYLIQ